MAQTRVLLGRVQGDPGPATTINVGPTTTGAPGTNASVTATGTDPRVLNFTIPRGDPGPASISPTTQVTGIPQGRFLGVSPSGQVTGFEAPQGSGPGEIIPLVLFARDAAGNFYRREDGLGEYIVAATPDGGAVLLRLAVMEVDE